MPTPAEKIAIVAVHGVGNCAHGQTARELVTLLQHLEPDAAGPRYGPFVQEQVMLPVRPIRDFVNTAPPEPSAAPDDARSQNIGSRSSFLRSSGTASQDDPGLAFSLHCVSGFDGEKKARTYETPVLRGERVDAGGSRQRVDVFEMYWSDLSSQHSTLAALLGELYHVLLHVGSLARTTADMLWKQHRTAHPALGVVRSAVGAYVWLFTVLVVALNLALLVLGTAVAPLAVSAQAPEWTCWLAFAAAAAAAVWVLRIYDRRRPGALWMGLVVLAIAAGGVFDIARQAGAFTQPRVPELFVGAMGATFFLLPIVGVVLMALYAVATVAGIVGWVRADPAVRHDIRASHYTIRIGMLVPAGLFCVATVLIWIGLHLYLRAALPTRPVWIGEFFRPGCEGSWVCHVLSLQDWLEVSATGLASQMVDRAGSPYLNVFFMGLVAALVLLGISLAPSLVKEFAAPQAPQSSDPERSRRTGRWLDRAFTIFGPVSLFVFGISLGLSFGAIGWDLVFDDICPAPSGPPWRAAACTWLSGNHTLVQWIGGATAAVMLLLRALQPAARAAIDIALDVDRWLQQDPLSQNPRARMFSRYYAVPDHVMAQGYDRVLIVAHSQGCVLTADLLRLLEARGTAAWLPLGNVRLLTVGNPLGQLYARRFPLQYAWATGDKAHELLGVHTWLNLYRSGDYVGRQVWGRPDAPDAYRPLRAEDLLAFCRQRQGEHCIGDGAHTHYFDGTAHVVGEVIDRLATTVPSTPTVELSRLVPDLLASASEGRDAALEGAL